MNGIVSTKFLRADPVKPPPLGDEARGWMHWPANEDYSLQFMRPPGPAQEGASTTCDDESWHCAESHRGRQQGVRAAAHDGERHMKLHRKEHHMKIHLSGPTAIVPRPVA